MKNPLIALLIISGSSLPIPLLAEEQWQASTLSAESIHKIQTKTEAYHQCLHKEVSGFPLSAVDSRDATNAILKKCEPRLIPIRELLLLENVTPRVANRYLLSKRHQAARNVLKSMMYAESQRQAPK